jgi:hypothetical protein
MEANYERHGAHQEPQHAEATADGNLIAMGRSMAIQILDQAGTGAVPRRSVAYGSKIYVDDGDAVKRGRVSLSGTRTPAR